MDFGAFRVIVITLSCFSTANPLVLAVVIYLVERMALCLFPLVCGGSPCSAGQPESALGERRSTHGPADGNCPCTNQWRETRRYGNLKILVGDTNGWPVGLTYGRASPAFGQSTRRRGHRPASAGRGACGPYRFLNNRDESRNARTTRHKPAKEVVHEVPSAPSPAHRCGQGRVQRANGSLTAPATRSKSTQRGCRCCCVNCGCRPSPPSFTERADREGWPAARLLATSPSWNSPNGISDPSSDT